MQMQLTLLTHFELPMASIMQMMAKSIKTQKISLSRLRSRDERLPCTPVAFIMICARTRNQLTSGRSTIAQQQRQWKCSLPSFGDQ
jgi:hypothetical protein